MKNTLHNQRGAGHLALIAGIVVVAVVAATGWWVLSKNKDETKSPNSSLNQEVATALKNAKCEYDDKDLCKFFTGWKLNDTYSITTDTKGGDTNGDSFVVRVDNNKTQLIFKGSTAY
jgi:hypothetical protein